MNSKAFVSVSLLLVILVCGCTAEEEIDTSQFKEVAEEGCTTVCLRYMMDGISLSDGSCLSNEIAQDWVCDVVHNPRRPVDDLPENQCSAYRDGEVHHFVEVSPMCDVIKSV